jgi:hypothetical protein
MSKILIYPVDDLDASIFDVPKIQFRRICEAALVVLKTPTHFRVVKNRFDDSTDDEKIPNFLFIDYILRYKDRLSDEDIAEALK